MIQKEIDITKAPTKQQMKMLENAKKMDIEEDDEYPSFSKEELKQFYKIKDKRNIERQKQVVTIRLSQKSINKAKSLGKGYTSILSRILESVLDDPKAIKHFL